MWLDMNVHGVVVQLRIRGYETSRKDDWYSQWCKCDFAFRSYEIAYAYVEWKVCFWDEGLTDNYLTVTLGHDEIILLRDYLSSVIRCKNTSGTCGNELKL